MPRKKYNLNTVKGRELEKIRALNLMRNDTHKIFQQLYILNNLLETQNKTNNFLNFIK
jgi:hypothetical protein